MDTNELLQELDNKIQKGELKKEDVISRLDLSSSIRSSSAIETEKKTRHFSVTKLFYIIGAVIVLIGILIFTGQIWDDIGSFGRVFVTLGMGLIIAGIGSYLFVSKPDGGLGSVFHFIGGLLIPGGAMVALYETGFEFDTMWPPTIIFAILSGFYLLLTFVQKRQILTFFAIANVTTFIYLFVISMMIENPSNWIRMHEDEIFAYLTMIIGISYLLLSWAFRQGWNSRLASVLSFLGTAGFYGAAFSQVFDSVPWQLIFVVLIILGFYLSIAMKQYIILILSTIFLIVHISYITSEYFADSFGWPISLIVLGFVFIGLGYMSFSIGKKYISQ